MRFDADSLARNSHRLEKAKPEEILEFAFMTYSPNIAISTAFGVDGCAMIHIAHQINPDVRVFTVDTGFLFPETLQLRDEFVERYGIALETFEGSMSIDQQAAKHGEALYERDTDLCCSIRKVAPTSSALSGLDSWVAALRRDQGTSRADINILELHQHDDGRPLVKIHPFANMTRRDVWQYVLDNKVPYNPLLDQGYKSIGCMPCTSPVGADGDERSGRWDGSKQECGIHTVTLKVGKQSADFSPKALAKPIPAT